MAKPFMIAVGGGSGSGKTTVVGLLQESLQALGVLVVSQDHYYRDLSHLTPDERNCRNFDQPEALDLELLREQMQTLSQGGAIARPSYDFATHTRHAQTVDLAPAPIIFLDGILSLCDAKVLEHFNMSIYIDVPDDIRILRRLQRDVAERGRTVPSVISQYLETVRPMHQQHVAPTKSQADVVVDWVQRDEDKVKQLAERIMCMVKDAP